MDEAVHHMQTLFGLNPNVIPPSLQFPRLPPGLMHPMTSSFSTPRKITRDASSLMPNIEDFQQMYQKHASELLQLQNSRIIPPGHPLYTKQISVSILKSENEKLMKENLELKKHLDETTKPNP